MSRDQVSLNMPVRNRFPLLSMTASKTTSFPVPPNDFAQALGGGHAPSVCARPSESPLLKSPAASTSPLGEASTSDRMGLSAQPTPNTNRAIKMAFSIDSPRVVYHPCLQHGVRFRRKDKLSWVCPTQSSIQPPRAGAVADDLGNHRALTQLAEHAVSLGRQDVWTYNRNTTNMQQRRLCEYGRVRRCVELRKASWSSDHEDGQRRGSLGAGSWVPRSFETWWAIAQDLDVKDSDPGSSR